MNNHQGWAYSSPDSPASQYSQPPSALSRAITTLALLVLGYYGLVFFDLWPATLKRRFFETFLHYLPPQLILIMQYGLSRLGLLARDGRRFRLEDLSNQHAKSEALQQMLGFENTRITTVVRKARTLSGLDNILPTSNEIGPPGLGNWDNSCYQNSVLHGFASLPAFNMFIAKSWDLMWQNCFAAPTHEALVAFLGKLNVADERRRTLWTPGVLKSMDSWQQQDAQEYLSRILDEVEKEDVKFYKGQKRKVGFDSTFEDKRYNMGELMPMPDAPAEGEDLEEHGREVRDPASTLLTDGRTTLARVTLELMNDITPNRIAGFPSRNPVDGMLAQSLKCRMCGFSEGLSLVQFNCLTVNLGNGGHCTVEDLLDEYTAPEDIDGVECEQCTKLANPETDEAASAEETDATAACSTPRRKPKPVLSTKSKQITIGRLPTDLVIHINRSIFDGYGNQRKNTALVDFPLRLNIFNAWCAPLDNDGKNAIRGIYELRCAVTHYGRHDDGHYIAYARREKGWFCFNDEVVTSVTEDLVLGRGNAFMLFYEAVDGGVEANEIAITEIPAEDVRKGTEVAAEVTEEILRDTQEDTVLDKLPPNKTSEDADAAVEAPVKNYGEGPKQAIVDHSVSVAPAFNTASDLAEIQQIQISVGGHNGPTSSSATSDVESADEVEVVQLEAPIPAMRTSSASTSVNQPMELSPVASVF